MSQALFQPALRVGAEQPIEPGAEAAAAFDRARFDRLSEARAAQDAALAGEEGVWTASASGAPPELTCTLNASAVAFVSSVEGPDGNFVRSLVTQTNADIHNPYVFVGVTLGIYTDVFDNNNVVLTTFYHEAFAGAILDPQGNNKAYSWVDTKVMPAPRLDRINGIRLRLVNVS
jgi:hypothetical protein